MDEPSVPVSGRIRSGAFANAAVAFLIWFVLALVTLHVLRPDYSPARHFISDYAVGRHGWVMVTAFLALSGGCLTLMLALLSGAPRAVAARLGMVLLGVASVGLVVTAIFPTDLPGAPYTRSGDIHGITFLVNACSLVLAAILLSISFGGDARWRPFQRTAIALVVVAVLAFLAQFLSLQLGRPVGLANRFFAGALVSWLMATASRARMLGHS